MVRKVLFAANLESFFTKFLLPQLKYFKDQGYEVHIACGLEGLDIPYCDKKFDINFARSLNVKQNLESYKQIKEVLKNEKYDLISCHTPFGGAITRLAYKSLKIKDTKMVYMAHGFHFYKGAPLFNWLVYYPVEKYLAKFTDTVITINLDDYEIAKKKFKTNVRLVKGVGLDVSKFNFEMSDIEKEEYRKSLGLNKDDFVMIYPAEILPRKRQKWLIQTLEKLLIENPKIHLLLPGKDSMNGKCHELVKKLKLESQISFLGFRRDIPKLITISDLAVTSSMQEGLPVNVMEAMYVGLPIVATACRGNRDLIESGKNGFVVGVNDKEAFLEKVKYFSKISKEEKSNIKNINQALIKPYLLESVLQEIIDVYEEK